MTESMNGRAFIAGIVDFNTKQMTEEDVKARGIPPYLTRYVADLRQYPLHIAMHFPDGVSWFRADQPWYFKDLMEDPKNIRRLKESDVLIWSGSGLSAHKFQHGEPQGKYQEALVESQQIMRDHLGAGKWAFGICYGGQLAIAAVGGKIGRLPKGITEAGWLTHKLTRAGARDEVFGFLPEKFGAPHFHNDYVEKLPVVGTKIQTSSGVIRVVRSDVLVTRDHYTDATGDHFRPGGYIMASVVEFNNGACLYQIQPHPEMADPEYANFLVRMNPWLAKEMGEGYYRNALYIRKDAVFEVAKLIPTFVRVAKERIELQQGVNFVNAMAVQNLFRYLLP